MSFIHISSWNISFQFPSSQFTSLFFTIHISLQVSVDKYFLSKEPHFSYSLPNFRCSSHHLTHKIKLSSHPIWIFNSLFQIRLCRIPHSHVTQSPSIRIIVASLQSSSHVWLYTSKRLRIYMRVSIRLHTSTTFVLYPFLGVYISFLWFWIANFICITV